MSTRKSSMQMVVLHEYYALQASIKHLLFHQLVDRKPPRLFVEDLSIPLWKLKGKAEGKYNLPNLMYAFRNSFNVTMSFI